VVSTIVEGFVLGLLALRSFTPWQGAVEHAFAIGPHEEHQRSNGNSQRAHPQDGLARGQGHRATAVVMMTFDDI